jgi:hypothetical protein
MNTSLIILGALGVLTVLGGIVVLLDHVPFGAETHRISVRDCPNVAADLHSAPRRTVSHQ